MNSQIFTTFKLFLLLTLITGLLYPACLTGISALAFPEASGGSILRDSNGEARASALVGQNFDKPGEFWGRPSQTAEHPYNAMAAAGSNLGTSNPALLDTAQARIVALKATRGVPVDLITSSGSGLDPHISPEAAMFQVERVSRATRQSPLTLHRLISRNTEPATIGVIGQARVNVVRLNLDLTRMMHRQSSSSAPKPFICTLRLTPAVLIWDPPKSAPRSESQRTTERLGNRIFRSATHHPG